MVEVGFVFLIILFLWILRIEGRLNKRLNHLDRKLSHLEDQLERQTSSSGAETQHARTPHPATDGPVTEPPPTETASAPFAIEPETQPAPFAPRPSNVSQHDSDDTLEDIELPENEDQLVRDTEPTSTPVLTPHRKEPQPSLWAERWRHFKANVDWELFTGVKLFAWLGGVALFIAAGFFVKFSIDRNLIPPALRLAIGALTGIALVIAAGRFNPKKFNVMRHTLAAGGIGVLYSVVFAATLYYEYLSKPIGFGLLSLVSVAAFVLAVHYQGVAISVLGALGAYATPFLVSMGQSGLLLLLGYLVVVNIGLYQVAKRLATPLLLLIATIGTLAALSIGTLSVYTLTNATVVAIAWIGNLALFSCFLRIFNADPGQNRTFFWSGLLVYHATLVTTVLLIYAKPGWAPVLMITTAQTMALALTWRMKGWFGNLAPFSCFSFLAMAAWVWLRFDPAEFSIGFVLLLFYGAVGGIGPLLIIQRHGLHKSLTGWLKLFPLAIVVVSLSTLFQRPFVSFWFWPFLLLLELIGIGVSLLLRAFLQVSLLVLAALICGLNGLFQMPAERVGIEFFIFSILSGMVLCGTVWLILKKAPQWTAALNLTQPQPTGTKTLRPELDQWLAATPAGGLCILLAASFWVPYPHYPHPGLTTLTCFLVLTLFAVHRLKFEIPGAAVLLAAAAAQAICVLHPPAHLQVAYPAFIWATVFFVAALWSPFFFFKSFDQWPRLWNTWALFEVIQAFFILHTSHMLWPVPGVRWFPLGLAVLKLPCVILLFRQLDSHPRRNSILAFHGGVLLFYMSALPVLVLSHGWIGMTFVLEAAGLLWLNRRIDHPGLRWVSLVLAPTGLMILVLNLSLLKHSDSLPVLNAAVLTVTASFITLSWAVTQAAYPDRRLHRRLDLPAYFQWLTIITGFFLMNLVIADIFAQPGHRFQIWPDRNFLQFICYGLTWTAMGGVTWRLLKLPRSIRKIGLMVAVAGAVLLIGLPFLLPEAAADMRPFFNLGLLAYLPLLGMLYYLSYKEPWDDHGSRIKNLLLALFMIAGFLVVKFQSSTIFQSGYPFTLFSSHTPTRGAVSAAGWIAYGTGLLIWPRRLDPPFRLAGTVLIIIGLLKTLALPFRFKVQFATMPPLLNLPTLVFIFCLAVLIYLTLKPWDQRWPLKQANPRVFWGIALAITAFGVLNIEIASIFSVTGRPFSMLTHGSLAMQLAYSIGWLLFAIALLAVGIKWDTVQVRWTAIAFIVFTAFKIFIRDLWHLGQLYRVGSLFGLAVVLILVSFLYQRFLSEGKKDAS